MKTKDLIKKYLGFKEKKGNSGFENKEFEKEMRTLGFYTGAPWCGFFVRFLWFKLGLNFNSISSSAKKCSEDFKNSPHWSNIPQVNAVAVFVNYKNGVKQSTGHVCLVTAIHVKLLPRNGKTIAEGAYATFDGNSYNKDNSSNTREGTETAMRNRTLNDESWRKENGLRLLGFILPHVK
jgi:hypothetical protein